MKLWVILMIGWLIWTGYLSFSGTDLQTSIYHVIVNTLGWVFVFGIFMIIYEVYQRLKRSREFEESKEVQEKFQKVSVEAQKEELNNLSNEIEMKKLKNKFMTRILNFFR